MSGLEAKPKSPERLRLLNIERAGYGKNGLEVTVTLTYDTWCCSGSHEIIDALTCVQKTIAKSKERARNKRLEKISEENLKDLQNQLELDLEVDSDQ